MSGGGVVVADHGVSVNTIGGGRPAAGSYGVVLTSSVCVCGAVEKSISIRDSGRKIEKRKKKKWGGGVVLDGGKVPDFSVNNVLVDTGDGLSGFGSVDAGSDLDESL